MRGLIGRLTALGRGRHFNRDLGALGERLAVRHLRRRGHRILETNWTSPRGEIDIISALDDGTLVFTEVKTRRGAGHGEPLEAVDGAKHAQVMAVSQDYIRRWRLERRPVRCDLIGVLLSEDGTDPRIDHVEGVI
ncbi:YraN family protein [Candidatus Sumerlaeota bacterium]|nr:YraN family protein [Candidatus Sumerlaeota bacterium]